MDVHFTNAHFTLTDGKLTKNGEVIAKDTDGFIGKKYWGNGHLNELYNIYVENKPLRIKDIENTMNTVFALYESAKSGGKEIVL